jgi:hypothetical protein
VGPGHESRFDGRLHLRNIGAGPALGVRGQILSNDIEVRIVGVVVAAGASEAARLAERTGPINWRNIVGSLAYKGLDEQEWRPDFAYDDGEWQFLGVSPL